MPCPMAHRGFCATRDAWCVTQVRSAAKGMYQALLGCEFATWWHLAVQGLEGYLANAWFMLNHTRLGGPQINLVTPASRAHTHERGSHLELGNVEEGFGHCLGVSLLARIWKAAGQERAVEAVFLSQAPARSGPLAPCPRNMFLLDEDWRSLIFHTQVQVFPPRPNLQTAKGSRHLEAGLLVALKRLGDGKCAVPMRLKSASTGIHVAAPPVGGGVDGVGAGGDGGHDGDHSDDGGSIASVDDGAGASGSSEGESDVPPADALLHELGAGGGDGGDGGDGESRSRLIPFGRWSISAVMHRGVHTGWGANCNSHYGSHLNCKKSFAAGAGGLDEARCLAKAWLLRGLDLSPASPTGRTDHVHSIGRAQLVPLEPEAVLDERASRL